MLEPESDWRTSGSASNSFTLAMPLAFRSSTTLCGGRGCDAAVPQLTPRPSTLAEVRRDASNNRANHREMGADLRFCEGISAEGSRAAAAASCCALHA